ncbi:MAG: site-specific integrase [Methanoregula sp.]|jgi:integrase|uniref:tyrosine-type recombinase/integrase n=1 Tax=Methanoregula sp. TaxID=2052170 RepID=UPI003D0DF012
MERLFTSAKQFYDTDSVKTRKAYRKSLIEFGRSKYGDIPDDEVFKKLDQYIRKGNRQTVLDDLRGFKKYLDRKEIVKHIDGKDVSTGYAIKSKMLHIAVVQSWLTKNEMGLPRAYSGEFTYKEKPDFNDQAFTPETAKEVFDMLATPVSKCLFIFLLSTGCRINEATNVRLDEVKWETKLPDGSKGPVRIRLDGSYTKNGKARIVFLTSEAENLLRDIWIDKKYSRIVPGPDGKKEVFDNGRGWYLKAARNKNRGLVGYSGKPAGKRPSIMADDRLFPFSNSVASQMLTTVIRRAGFTERTKTGINKLHIHSTRKFFRTQFGQAAGPDAAETLMGHSPGLTSNYRLLEEAQLAQIFKKHERALFINRDKEAELVKERVEKQSDRIAAQDRIIEKMQRELDILVHAAEIAEKMKV